MILVRLDDPDDFSSWRDQARQFVSSGIPPEAIRWTETGDNGDLFASAPVRRHAANPPQAVRASRDFLDTMRSAILHRDPQRLDLAYRLLWRLQDLPRLLDDAADPDVLSLRALARQVHRDVHKMRAFVRFRQVTDADGIDRFVAWFEPEHRIERHNAQFFLDRFANQRWSILTPRMALHWDGAVLSEGPAAHRNDAPSHDDAESLWLAYYRSIFNPARLKIGAMVKEMPRKYWKNLPEAHAIADLIAGAQKRESAMIATGSSLFDDALPASLTDVADNIAACRRCPIGCNGTRAVMGEGPLTADLMIVGEQPGDNEEVQGRPFIGPAGQLLDEHLRDAGIVRERAYLTNAVKHFKFELRGKRRLHQTPTAGEIDVCRWWLDAERAVIRPKMILALGASSGRAILGRTPSISRESGQITAAPDGTPVWLVAHPSYLLRMVDEARAREELRFNQNLRALARHLSGSAAMIPAAGNPTGNVARTA